MKPNTMFMYSPKGHPVTNCIYRLMVEEGETRQILWDFHFCMNLVYRRESASLEMRQIYKQQISIDNQT